MKVALDRILVFHPESLTSEEAAKKLKDRFYYGVRQNVREGLGYYYEVLQADYTTLLTKARSIEAEKSTSAATHTVTMKSASTMETGAKNQTDELTRQMNELITIVKNQQVQNTKGGNKNSSNRYNVQDKLKGNSKERKEFKRTRYKCFRPIQEWGPHHSSVTTVVDGDIGPLNAHCLLNYQRGEDPKKKKGTNSPSRERPKCRPDQTRPKHKSKPELKSLHD